MVGIIGGEFFSNSLIKELERSIDVKLITTDLRDPYLQEKAADSDIIHYIYSPLVTIGGLRTVQKLKKMNKRIIVHWIGTDVYNAVTKYKSKFITKKYKYLIDVHAVVHSRLASELNSIDVDCQELPLPYYKLYDIKPLPEQKKILVYMPDSRNDFFGKIVIDKLIDYFPELEFVVLPNSGKDYDKTNVTCLSWVDDMEKVYRDVTTLIRLPFHDGLPNSVIEALSMGRFVIYSHEFPHCEYAKSFEEVKKKLEHLVEKRSPNQMGSDYVKTTYDKNKIIKRLLQVYEEMR